MARIIFEFENESDALDFMAYMSDGGGEYMFLNDELSETKNFDYSAAWRSNGPDFVIKAIR